MSALSFSIYSAIRVRWQTTTFQMRWLIARVGIIETIGQSKWIAPSLCVSLLHPICSSFCSSRRVPIVNLFCLVSHWSFIICHRSYRTLPSTNLSIVRIPPETSASPIMGPPASQRTSVRNPKVDSDITSEERTSAYFTLNSSAANPWNWVHRSFPIVIR